MAIIFTCENCGKRFKVDERSQGRRGRCSVCHHVMRIPGAGVAEVEHAHAPDPAAQPAADLPFKLSPPEPHPMAHQVVVPAVNEPAPAHPSGTPPLCIRRWHPPPRSGINPARTSHTPSLSCSMMRPMPIRALPFHRRSRAASRRSPNSRRAARVTRSWANKSALFTYLGLREDGPAGWVYTKWRAGVSSVLKVIRWVDTWAYLISVPFIVLMIFGIAAENRKLIHTGAVVVVLANYGRFWADLLALFVRPYKDGPVHGLAFLFPPYTVYYLVTRWDSMKKIVRRIATSCIPILAVILIYAFDSSANPDGEKRARTRCQDRGRKTRA